MLTERILGNVSNVKVELRFFPKLSLHFELALVYTEQHMRHENFGKQSAKKIESSCELENCETEMRYAEK